MREILIAHPEINSDKSRRWTYRVDPTFRVISQMFNDFEITPQQFPKACDLWSGDGALALFLIQRGWNPTNIICVDKDISPTPLVHGVHWIYMNIKELYKSLNSGESLPEEVEKLRGMFDIVIQAQGYLETEKRLLIDSFFIRSKGYVYHENVCWKEENGSLTLVATHR